VAEYTLVWCEKRLNGYSFGGGSFGALGLLVEVIMLALDRINPMMKQVPLETVP
jgi:hypothetical protein